MDLGPKNPLMVNIIIGFNIRGGFTTLTFIDSILYLGSFTGRHELVETF